MYMYDLEKIKNENKFIDLILKTCNEQGLDNAIRLVKKSGYCINFFGTGKPVKEDMFNKLIDLLNDLVPNEKEEITKFQNEVLSINNLYKYLNNNFLQAIEQLIHNDIHINSYIIALELFLSNDIYKMKHKSGLNDNRSDYFENVAESSGNVLQYLIKFKKFPLESSSLKISFENVQNASLHIKGAEYRAVLDVFRELWNYFEVDITVDGGSVKAISKGERTLGKTISHMKFMDVRNAKQVRYGYQQLQLYGNASTISKTRKLAPNDFISYNERMACEFVEEYFSTDNLELKFIDVTIAEFIRAYIIISNECEKFIKKRKLRTKYEEISINDVCICKTKNKWIYLFVEWGIKQKSAEKIFDFLVFNKHSNDLFDCPLLKVGEEYIVVPSISSMTDASRALLSNLKSKEIEVDIKGTLFEEEIRKNLKKAGVELIHLEKKDYECDAVFSLDNSLFFVEAKHLNDPTSYRSYIRNLDEIHAAAVQLNRIVDYYIKEENLENIKKRLGLSLITNIYRVVVTNTSQGESLKINGVYTIDDIGFSGYFLRNPPQSHEMNKESIKSNPIFYKHYTGPISTQQFIDFMDNNPFIEHYKQRIEYETYNYSEQLGLTLKDYGVGINSVINTDKLTIDELKKLNELL
ncbi:hypothetical protein A8L34_10105 [Bacillus sp. FJAT-27264]|uniref:hypothetical protein n=1 Tax=Paenibacillus sp. (strain DSM 101736 / FJAT-27264) TaxID=1850362 RepID=UPI000807B091|nr:hypothetical protein [Bacillus sp. FJAT-27264]OBZ14296.1 hypothetical protein A8L34_10105 [Bacillus sp. FJAT-27264]